MSIRKSVGNGLNVGVLATNVISNGNFADTTGWSGGGANLTAASNTLTVTGTGANAAPEVSQITTLDCATNKIIYVKCLARVTNASSSRIRINVFGTTGGAGTIVTQLSPAQNTWYALSGVFTLTVAFTGKVQPDMFSTYADAATANGKVMEVQNFLLVDLTEKFGAGNEPSAVECDALFQTWFNGTIGVRPTMSVNSPLRQL